MKANFVPPFRVSKEGAVGCAKLTWKKIKTELKLKIHFLSAAFRKFILRRRNITSEIRFFSKKNNFSFSLATDIFRRLCVEAKRKRERYVNFV